MIEEEIHSVIGNLSDGDRTLEAFLGLVDIAAEAETQAALNSGSDPHLRAYDCGRASALRDLLSDIDTIREARRQE